MIAARPSARVDAPLAGASSAVRASASANPTANTAVAASGGANANAAAYANASASAGSALDGVGAVESVLREALALGASDVHLDPAPEALRVRARVDGVLVDLAPLPAALGPRMVGRLKALADLLAYQQDLPQEGRIARERSPIGREVRVATYPALGGERVALRLEAQEGDDRGLDGLGLPAAVQRGLAAAIAAPDGVVLVTGPSGSGKTTTLYACLRALASAPRARSLVTIEDPVERRLAGVVQTEVRPSAGLTFARALRSLVRQDPEVLLVGEVRDRETAAIALEAGLTGHLVLSTVHAGTAPLVFARLLDMGVEPFALTTAVRGVLAQRLVRRRCTACEGAACAACGGAGYRGRALLAEWLPVGPLLRRAVLARADGEALADAARADGATSLAEEAARLVAAGTTTAAEVERVLGHGALACGSPPPA